MISDFDKNQGDPRVDMCFQKSKDEDKIFPQPTTGVEVKSKSDSCVAPP